MNKWKERAELAHLFPGEGAQHEHKQIAFLFPGQGAQYVGMGRDFFDHFSCAKEVFLEADDILGRNLSKLIFDGPKDELTLTKNSQIAIYVVSVAIWKVLKQQLPGIHPRVCAGLSLGEYSALTAAGYLKFSDGVQLVQNRGLYMHEASLMHPGTMAVVLGLDSDSVKERVDSCPGVWVANLNCPGQVVISGTAEGINHIKKELMGKGAKRILPLKVSGAFHSGLMEEAREKLAKAMTCIKFKKSKIECVMNVTGDYVSSLEGVRENLINQVTSPVFWEKSIEAMNQTGISEFIEIGCGKTLTGMSRKMDLRGRFLSVEKVEDLELLDQALDSNSKQYI